MLALVPPRVEGDQVPAVGAVVQAAAGGNSGDVGDRQHRGAGGLIAVAGLAAVGGDVRAPNRQAGVSAASGW